MTTRRQRPRPRDAGFVLIGVVIFVLALTIIGISLFSLSGYEAQFLQRSLDGEQAFQSAVGGLERARFVVCETGRLERVAHNLPRENVVAAIAFQVRGTDSVSTGPVEWVADQPVHLRVTAWVNGRERTVAARFTPDEVPSYYRKLVATGGGIEVRHLAVSPHPTTGLYTPRGGTVLLDGLVWETSGQDTTAWTQWLAPPRPGPIQASPGVPIPEVGDFIARHPTTRRPMITFPGGTKTYTLQTGSDTPAYRITDDTSNPTWSLFEDYPVHEIDIRVQGCIVWLLPRGARFCHQPHVTGLSGGGRDCLVMVAGRNGPVTNTVFDEYGMDSAGIWFQGGLQADIPVILVSNGKVAIWHDNEYSGATVNTWANDLSIFAGSVSLMGPEQTNWMRLRHPAGGSLETTLLPLLLQHAALPNSGSSSGHSLDLITGTWRASAP